MTYIVTEIMFQLNSIRIIHVKDFNVQNREVKK